MAQKPHRRTNTFITKGIFLHPNGKYRVTIIKHKKTIHLGYFKTLDEAKEVRLNAEKEYFGEYRYKGGNI